MISFETSRSNERICSVVSQSNQALENLSLKQIKESCQNRS